MKLKTSRRGFLKSASAAAAVLLIGARSNGALAAVASDDTMLTPFVKMRSDGSVVAIIKHFEKGQGPATGLTTLIAEELGVTMDQIGFEFAPSDPKVYNNLFFGEFQSTGGSTAIANSYMQYRQAGAAARTMLIAAAAKEWGVEASELKLEAGVISGAGHSAPFGEFVAGAAQIEVPTEPKLKDPTEFTLIGNAKVKRKDTPSKINGTAKFAMDMQFDNQMVVVVTRMPKRGATVVSFDDSAAREVKGFIEARVLPNKAGIAVYADKTWPAIQAREALSVEWDFSTAETRSSDQVREELLAQVNAAPEFNVAGTDPAETAAKIEGAATVLDETFYFPLLAHSPMEPLTCTIAPDADGGVTVHDGAQFPTSSQMAVASALELPVEQVRINTLLAGGSFGRRATLKSDYQLEAAMAFAMTDRRRPVKLVWTREDDIRGGYYRPAVAHRVRVGLDAEGNILGWDHRLAAQPILKGTVWEGFGVTDGVDFTSVEGVSHNPYDIPGMFIGLSDAPAATDVLWFRSVGHTHTGYVMERMMDLAASAAGRDPVEFRLDHLTSGGEKAKDQERIAGVLKLAAEKAGWGSVAEGRSKGVAVHKSFNSYVAEVVEISGSAEDGVRIEKVTCAVDCGVAVNPDVIKAQMEGGIGYGLGHAMRAEITLTEGEIDQYNFPDYEPLRIADIAAIDVHIVASNEAPTGVGEPGVPPSAPALANAIEAAGGPRVTELPMTNSGVSFS